MAQLPRGRTIFLYLCIWVSFTLLFLQLVSSFDVPCPGLSRRRNHLHHPSALRTFSETGASSTLLWSSTDNEKLDVNDDNVDDQRLQREPPQQQQQPILCDLQTLMRLAACLGTGGSAKVAIQSGECLLNGQVETRRAKKLVTGDIVEFQGKTYDVKELVKNKGYTYKAKSKKVKPPPKVLEDGSLEFGGRYRSQEWRDERRQKKMDRKKGVSSSSSSSLSPSSHLEELRKYLPKKSTKDTPRQSYHGQTQEGPS